MIGFRDNDKEFKFGCKVDVGVMRNVSASFLQDSISIGYLNYISKKTEKKLDEIVNGQVNIERMINRSDSHLLLNISLLKKRVKWTVKKLYGQNSGNIKFISSIGDFKFSGHLMYFSYCVDRYIWFILLSEDDEFKLLQKANEDWLKIKEKGNDPAKPSSLYGTSYVYVMADGQGSTLVSRASEMFMSYSEKIKLDLNLNFDFKNKGK